jgi:hypothetical protein
LLVELLRANHVAVDPQRTQFALQPKPKPARLIHRVHRCATGAEFGRPVHKRFLLETLRRFGITAACLHHHHVKILMHINAKLDVGFCAIKLAAGFLE